MTRGVSASLQHKGFHLGSFIFFNPPTVIQSIYQKSPARQHKLPRKVTKVTSTCSSFHNLVTARMAGFNEKCAGKVTDVTLCCFASFI